MMTIATETLGKSFSFISSFMITWSWAISMDTLTISSVYNEQGTKLLLVYIVRTKVLEHAG